MSTTMIDALRKLFTAYGQGRDLERAAVYAEMLSDLDPGDVAEAVRVCCQTGGRFLPTISELRSVVAESRCSLPDADVAWGEVLRAIRRVGRYRIPSWSSQAVADAVEAIGWQALCDTANQDVTRAHFARAYTSTRRRAIEAEQTGQPLLGTAQRLQIGGAK